MNSFMVWYIDARNQTGVAVLHGPHWNKAWQVAINTLYQRDARTMPVLLLRVEQVIGEERKRVYESPYKKLVIENNEHFKDLKSKLATPKNSHAGEGVGDGS